MRTMTVELNIDVLEGAFLQSLRDVKHDMLQQLRFIEMLGEGMIAPYVGIFDSCKDQDKIKIREFLIALEAVYGYYE